MEECTSWIERAKVKDTSYASYSYDHNSKWAEEFKKEKNRYLNMMVEIVKELEKTLNEIKPPTFSELKI